MITGLNDLINEAIKNEVFPGANYCLVADKVYLNSLGNKSLYPSQESNNIDTIYDLASVSKVISTTTAIMLLLEAGKIRLYDSVSRYLPRFRHLDVVIWDLLTHTSGLQADVHKANKIKSKDELLNQIYACDPIYPKNTKIVYSDIGFMLLGFIIEEVTGTSLDVFAKKNIFDKLEMYDTGYSPKNKQRCAPTELRNDEIYQGYLQGDVHDEKAYILGGVAGHAGVFSTVKDLSHFIKMIINDGKYNDKQFLSKPTIDLLFTKQVEIKNGISLDTDSRGLGWIVKGNYSSAGDLASPNTVLHTGYTGTNIFIDRTNQVGFALLSNRVHPTRENVKIIPFRGRVGNYVISHFYQGAPHENHSI